MLLKSLEAVFNTVYTFPVFGCILIKRLRNNDIWYYSTSNDGLRLLDSTGFYWYVFFSLLYKHLTWTTIFSKGHLKE